jgi:hypothetical protein
MKLFNSGTKVFTPAIMMFIMIVGSYDPSVADPSKYPEFAQHALPHDVAPSFIHLKEFVEQIQTGKKPLIIDVRSTEEYAETHILGSASIPLGELSYYLPSIPKDRPVVLY